MSDIRVDRFTGDAVLPHVSDVARLRIEVFREFPYLYEGSLAYEENYLRTYTEAPDSLFILLFDGDVVVGASTGVPLDQAEAAFRAPFEAHGYDPAAVFYFGESVLKADYRGRGLGRTFYETREAYARSLGRFAWAAFCAVERPADHPLRPADYVPLDAYWRKHGFEKHPELRTTYHWRDVGETEESDKPMVFWLKALD